MGDQSPAETVVRPIAKIKNAVTARKTGRGQAGRGAEGPEFCGSLNLKRKHVYKDIE